MLYYRKIEKAKNKDWVVFIHGIGGGSSIWFKQIREFRNKYNLLLIDLPGHGKTTEGLKNLEDYSFYDIADKIVAVLEELKIESAHFLGVSLGTIIIQAINCLHPEKVKKMVLAGAVENLNFFARTICKIFLPIKKIIPYMFIYRISAWVLMPRKRHKEARDAFVKEAVVLGQDEFVSWYNLHSFVNETIQDIKKKSVESNPRLYLMGSEDYVFLPFIKKIINKTKNSKLKIIKKCGHVCNIEKPLEFNEIALQFLS